jgi:inner membrane protein
MPGIGHLVVGMAAGRLAARRGSTTKALAVAMVGFALLSALPDADVIGFSLGIRYLDPLGHRGASHSLVAAGLVTLVVFALGSVLKWQHLGRVTLITAVVVASHGLLDTLTSGGYGCALLWPFSATRYFAPVRPIPVSPLGVHVFSPRGLTVLGTELVMFLPLLVYALAPRRQLAPTG